MVISAYGYQMVISAFMSYAQLVSLDLIYINSSSTVSAWNRFRTIAFLSMSILFTIKDFVFAILDLALADIFHCLTHSPIKRSTSSAIITSQPLPSMTLYRRVEQNLRLNIIDLLIKRNCSSHIYLK